VQPHQLLAREAQRIGIEDHQIAQLARLQFALQRLFVDFNPDGSLDLLLQADDPGADKHANWLPVPREAFNLTLRLYRPAPEALNGEWPLPVIELLPEKPSGG